MLDQLNQAIFYFVSIRGAVGGVSWERYFTYCPTVQNIRDTMKQEEGPWHLLELLDYFKGPTNGAYDITIRAANTTIGYVTVQKIRAYTKCNT